jgi:hypothetical protein
VAFGQMPDKSLDVAGQLERDKVPCSCIDASWQGGGFALGLWRRMRHLVILVCAFGTGSALGADTPVVKGELSFNSGGLAQVTECGTNRVFTLGVMASNPFFGLTLRYKEASGSGKLPVLVEVKGSATPGKSSDGKPVLNAPQIVTLVRGNCADKTPDK